MTEQYFSSKDTIYTITERYPETLSVLIHAGLDKLENRTIRQTIGKTMVLETVCQMRGIELESLIQQMNEVICAGRVEQIKVKGVLPCPIRIPLLEKIEDYIKTNELSVDYTLPAASVGVDWIFEELNGEEDLADIYLSAGFSLFFDQEKFGKYVDAGLFASQEYSYHPRFDNEEMSLKDPKGIYTLMGSVPAVFMVNKEHLGERKLPTSWEELLSEEFKNSIAVPMKDLDLFNAVLLNIYWKYGEDGVRRLGENCVKNMHPAQMVKNASNNQAPCVSISPYFFATMVPKDGPMIPVWPEDGAIVSPIFLLSKKEKSEQTNELVDYLLSREIGEVLSSNGKFPSTSVEVESGIEEDKQFMFCGWDFIYANDVARLIERLEDIFFQRKG